ncbi:MAG: hypothetical protein WAM39_13940 [Bryobacteraceae bacterium]
MASLYVRLGTITDAVTRTQTQIDTQVEHLRRSRGVSAPRPRDPACPRAHGDQGRTAGRERHAALDPGVDLATPPLAVSRRG